MLIGMQLPRWRVSHPAAFRQHFARMILMLALAATTAAVAAGQRRDFAATYAVTQVAETDNGIELTLTVTAHNYSGRDIENCGIVLNASDPSASPLGNFRLIKIFPDSGEITVHRRFTVPKGEFLRWQAGVHPALQILLPDGHDGTLVEPIDAHRETPIPEPAE